MRNRQGTRETGFRQVRSATRWIAGAAAVLVGFITVWETQHVHPASAGTPAVAHQPASPAPGGYSSYGGSTDVGGLQAPDVPPSSTDRQPSASSGGS